MTVDSNNIISQLRGKQYLVSDGLFVEGKDIEAESRGQNRSSPKATTKMWIERRARARTARSFCCAAI
jgi:hypothetical protein